jgi:tetratricopeptide (TPR) repeat protein
MQNLGTIQQEAGCLVEAMALYQEALTAQERSLGRVHPDTIVMRSNMACLLEEIGDLAEAEVQYRAVVRDRESSLGCNHPDTAVAWNNLGLFLLSQRNSIESTPLFRQCASAWQSREDWLRLWPLLGLALCGVLETGDAAPAEDVIAELAAMLGADHERVTTARRRLAAALQRDPGDAPKDSP